MTVQIGDGRSGELQARAAARAREFLGRAACGGPRCSTPPRTQVRKGDRPDELAERFCQEHGLDEVLPPPPIALHTSHTRRWCHRRHREHLQPQRPPCVAAARNELARRARHTAARGGATPGSRHPRARPTGAHAEHRFGGRCSPNSRRRQTRRCAWRRARVVRPAASSQFTSRRSSLAVCGGSACRRGSRACGESRCGRDGHRGARRSFAPPTRLLCPRPLVFRLAGAVDRRFRRRRRGGRQRRCPVWLGMRTISRLPRPRSSSRLPRAASALGRRQEAC